MSGPTVTLQGSMRNSHQLKECSSCGKTVPPEGGIQISSEKWRCSKCWRGFALRK